MASYAGSGPGGNPARSLRGIDEGWIDSCLSQCPIDSLADCDVVKEGGIDAHTRSAQMGNTVDVNENEYAVASFEQKLVAVRRLETAVVQ